MDPQELAKSADPAVMARYLAGLPRPAQAHAPSESVRQDEYQGHVIHVKSTYEVTIDGRSLALHLSVGNDGTVHCHSLPNYQSGSLIDVLRRLIDAYPDDFPAKRAPGGGATGGHGTAIGGS